MKSHWNKKLAFLLLLSLLLLLLLFLLLLLVAYYYHHKCQDLSDTITAVVGALYIIYTETLHSLSVSGNNARFLSAEWLTEKVRVILTQECQ